jgi:ubiquinone/menaquinone biosynthesis C-methylase UbiE
MLAVGERLPFRPGSFDGAIIIRGVLPYEDRVVAEISRVLRSSAELELITHGLGYYLAYLLCSHWSKRRLYALRTILNTWLYRATRLRVLGDTIYQSVPRLARYFAGNALEIVRSYPSRHFLCLPILIHLRVKRKAQRSQEVLTERAGGRAN